VEVVVAGFCLKFGDTTLTLRVSSATPDAVGLLVFRRAGSGSGWSSGALREVTEA